MTPAPPKDVSPYIGLRTFRESDQRYFCGRDDHVAKVLERLWAHHFVAVVGLSGSGKSSLVRAGVVPELRADMLKGSSSHWLIVTTTPEGSPMSRMASAFKDAVSRYWLSAGLPPGDVAIWERDLDSTLKGGSLGLSDAIEALRDVGLPERTCVLLIVDQFEELFRYKRRGDLDEAEGFIEQLLAASSGTDSEGSEETSVTTSGTYVVITMRSEFLGECARYQGLAEAVNSGLYLTPRLNPDQLAKAISVPARKFGRQIDIHLVRRLISDILHEQDQLPVLQHALMRCWKEGKELNEALYEYVGGTESLGLHAEGILRLVKEDPDPARGERRALIAERLFKRITKEGNVEGRGRLEEDGLRDPARLDEICTQIDCGEEKVREEEVKDVINAYRQEWRAFLRPECSETLDSSSVVDITHESLIRKWGTLQRWVREEAESKSAYFRLLSDLNASETLSKNAADTYHRLRKSSWSQRWAIRYGGDYCAAIQHLDASLSYHKAEEHRQLKEAEDRRLAEAAQAEQRRLADLEQAELRAQVAEARRQAESEKAERERDQAQRQLEEAEERRLVEVAKAELQAQVASEKAGRERDQAKRLADSAEQRRIAQIAAAERRMNGFFLGAGFALLLIALAAFFYRLQNNYLLDESRAAVELLKTGNDVTSRMDERVPAAIAGAYLAQDLGRPDYVQRWFPLDQWKLLANIRHSNSWPHTEDMDVEAPIPITSSGVAINKSRDRLAVASGTSVRIWDLNPRGGGLPRLLHKEPFCYADKVRFSEDGNLLVASSIPYSPPPGIGQGCGSQTKASIMVFSLGKDGGIQSPRTIQVSTDHVAALSPVEKSGKIAVITTDGKISIYPESGDARPVPRREWSKQKVASAFFSPNGRYLLISYVPTGDSEISQLIDFDSIDSKDSGTIPFPEDASGGQILSADFLTDGEWIATGSLLGRVRLWDISHPKVIFSFNLNYAVAAISVRIEGENKWIAAGTTSGLAYVLLHRNGPSFDVSDPFRHQGIVNWVELRAQEQSQTPTLITSSQDGKVRAFDIRSGTEELRITHRRIPVFGSMILTGQVLSATSDGRILITSPFPKKTLFKRGWFTGTACIAQQSAVAFTPTKAEWAQACEGMVTVAGGEKPSKIGHKSDRVLTMQFNAPGDSLIWVDTTPDATLYEVHVSSRSGSEWKEPNTKTILGNPALQGSSTHENIILAISRDGGLLAVAAPDKTSGKWNLQTTRLNSTGGVEMKQTRKSIESTKLHSITSLAISNAGRIAVGGDARSVLLEDSSKEIDWLPGRTTDDSTTALAFVDETHLLIASSNLDLQMQETSALDKPLAFVGQAKVLERNVGVQGFYVAENGHRFATISGNKVEIFDSATTAHIGSLLDDGQVQSMDLSATGDQMTTSILVNNSIAKILGPLASVTREIQYKPYASSICNNQPAAPDDLQQDAAAFWDVYHLPFVRVLGVSLPRFPGGAAPNVCKPFLAD